MTASLRVAIVFSVVVVAVSVQAALSVVPTAPTSDDVVTVRVPEVCSVSTRSVTRTDSNIRVALNPGPCPSPPYTFAHEVSLGKLPAGQYEVEVTKYSDVPPERITVIVLDADPAFTVRPFVVPVNTPSLPLHFTLDYEQLICYEPQCADWSLNIGGATLRRSDAIGGTELGITFHAPSLAPGLYDVTVTNKETTTRVPAAIYYHAPDGPLHPAIFERVLFPVLFSTGGAHGSEWRSEAVIANPTSLTIENANTVEPPVQCVTYPCGERFAPGERRAFSGQQYPHGVALMVPRRDGAELEFGLRVRDVSREEDTFGAEVPVVRESRMVRDGTLSLLDVPLDPRYRVKLRIYQFRDPIFEEDLNTSHVEVRVVAPDGTVIARPEATRWKFTRDCSGAACAWTPHFLELDLPSDAEVERADIQVEFSDGARGWAFASVTNNTTQQVTIVSPNSKGSSR